MITSANSTYITVAGDTWDTVALAVYGNTFYADVLMTAPENWKILDYSVFPAGVEVFVPELTVPTDDDLPEWRRT